MIQTGFLPAINIQVDKGTTVHNTHQFTTAAVVVPGSESLNLYLGQPTVNNHTGIGVASSVSKHLNWREEALGPVFLNI